MWRTWRLESKKNQLPPYPAAPMQVISPDLVMTANAWSLVCTSWSLQKNGDSEMVDTPGAPKITTLSSSSAQRMTACADDVMRGRCMTTCRSVPWSQAHSSIVSSRSQKEPDGGTKVKNGLCRTDFTFSFNCLTVASLWIPTVAVEPSRLQSWNWTSFSA